MKTTIVPVRLTPYELEILDSLYKRALQRNGWYIHGRSTIVRYGLNILDSLSDESFDNVINNLGRPSTNELKLKK